MAQQEQNDLLKKPETFNDIARICLKKQNKGPFDQVVAALYRIKNLTEYISSSSINEDEKKQLKALIIKGLRYKSFKEFKEEMQTMNSFAYLSEINTFREYFEIIKTISIETKKDLTKAFLIEINKIFTEHYHALNFLKSFVTDKLEKEEEKLKQLSSNT